MSSGSTLPDVAEVLRPILERVPREQQPLLIALAERMAAERYRGWAEAVARHQGNAQARETFLSCALLEEDNAAFLESISMSEENVLGSCFCGAVRFSVRLPTIFCGHCHCSMCRRSHGAGYVTWLAVPRGQFELEAGE